MKASYSSSTVDFNVKTRGSLDSIFLNELGLDGSISTIVNLALALSLKCLEVGVLFQDP